MIPTPEQVIPLVAPSVEPIRSALRRGIGYADNLQPDPLDRDQHFWAHSARFQARQELMTAPGPRNWDLVPGVPNSGIHLTYDWIHKARVVRSLDGTTPPPGPNRERRRAWNGVSLQGTLALGGDGTLPPLSLIVDWRDSKGEPEIHVGLPAGGWGYKGKARLHWRVEVPEGGIDLSELRFNPADSGDGTGERLVDLLYEVDEVDPKE